MLLTKALIVVGLLFLLLIAFVAMRKDRFRHGSTLGNALQEGHTAFDPGVRNAIEARQQLQVEEDESGEPPSAEE